mgnify:CR=1 FL=1
MENFQNFFIDLLTPLFHGLMVVFSSIFDWLFGALNIVNYVKNVLGLSVLAVSITHDFIPEATIAAVPAFLVSALACFFAFASSCSRADFLSRASLTLRYSIFSSSFCCASCCFSNTADCCVSDNNLYGLAV